MTDLDRELRRLDRLPAPDLHDDIEAHVAAPSTRLRLDPPRRTGARVAVAVVSLVASALVFVLLVDAFDGAAPPERRPSPSIATSPPQVDPWSSAATGWTRLPDPPETRVCPSRVWTGSELLVWGGEPVAGGGAASDGFAFDPTTATWSAIPAAPHGGTGCWPGVWTGSEALFWRDGLAFDPLSGAWREIASSPHDIPYRSPGVVWTGSELIVFGGDRPDEPGAREGAVYDKATDTWRLTTLAPFGLNLQSGVWTGSEAIFFGSLLDDRNRATTTTSVGLAYDPVADSWRALPPSRLSPQATSAVWLGDEMLAWDYEVRSQTYDPVADRWGDRVEMPLEFSECYPQSAAVERTALAYFCGQAATFDGRTGTWTALSGGPLDRTVEGSGGQTPLWRFADLVAAGSAVLVPAEGITITDGESCYGCEGSPQSLWLYRPA